MNISKNLLIVSIQAFQVSALNRSAISLTFYKLFYLFLLNNLLEDLEIYEKMIKYRDYFHEYRKLKREILNSVNKVFESRM